MAPLDGKWFGGIDDLPEIIAENLEVASLGFHVTSVLGKNGWDGKTAAGIGLELSPDNSSVIRGQFLIRGPLSDEPAVLPASKLWSAANKDILATISFPSAVDFDFANGSLTSDYLSGDAVKLVCNIGDRLIAPSEWTDNGIGEFCLRIVAYLDNMSNRTGPRIKYVILFFPASLQEMEGMSDAVQGTGWPGIKVLEGHASLFPPAALGVSVYIKKIRRCSNAGALMADALSKADFEKFREVASTNNWRLRVEPAAIPAALIAWINCPVPDDDLALRILKELAAKYPVLGVNV